jgi:hypothetical protein
MGGNTRFRLRAIEITSAITIALASGAAWADDPPPIAPPTDPVAKAAYDVLDKACARCHQEGKLSSRDKPAKNFGYVLQFDKLDANPSYILPGNPYGSKLFKQIVDGEMPYDVMYEGSTNYAPTPDDMKALEAWIKSLGAAVCDPKGFITNTDMIGFMAADLDRQPRNRVKGTRYLTLTNLRNDCVGEDAFKVYQQGAIKLINSLSRSSDVVRLEAIDPAGTILRINLDDLGWNASDWDTVLKGYPYNLQPDIKLTGIFKQATGTQLPYVRADWFSYYASRPPLYNSLLKLADTFQGLSKDQGVDVPGDIKKLVVVRAGFQKSGVSANNRLIERHQSRSGYYWTSYDFRGNEGVQNLFEHPLGPGGANGFVKDGFEEAGGETIYSLPNGFQAYYLNNNKGEKLDKGPTDIVRDLSSKDLAVTNGISCMGCHDQGMRKATDDIRAVVLSGKAFSKEIRDIVDVMFPEHDRMNGIIQDDAKRFAAAMARAGLDPTLNYSGVEMINALSKRYEGDLDYKLAAANFGLTPDQYNQAAQDADRKFRPLLQRLAQATVPFDQFEAAFRDLAVSITDDVVVDVGGGTTSSSQVAVVTPDAPKSPDLSLTSDKTTYQVGDSPSFSIVPSRDCSLTLTDVDDKGVGTVLFPNRFHQDNKVKAGVAITLPGPNAGFQYRMQDKGTETVIAVCSDVVEVDGIKHDFQKAPLTNVPDYTASVSRSIAVLSTCKRSIAVQPTSKTPAPGPTPAPAAAANASCSTVPVQQAVLPAQSAVAKPAAAPASVVTAVAVSESKRASFRAAITLPVQ